MNDEEVLLITNAISLYRARIGSSPREPEIEPTCSLCSGRPKNPELPQCSSPLRRRVADANRKFGRTLIAIFLIGFVLSSGSCGPSPRVQGGLPSTWATGPSEVVGVEDPPADQTDYFSRKDNEIHLLGGVNETVAFEYVLRGAKDTARGLVIGFEDLVSPSGALSHNAVRIYRHWPVTVERYPNWYLRSVGLRKTRHIPDALVPIDVVNHRQSFSISPGENLVLWVEIRIPFLAQVGTYQGAIVVQDIDGNSLRTRVVLEIRDLFLSQQDAIPVLARVQLKSIIATLTDLDPENIRLLLTNPQARRLIISTFKLLHEHGLSPFTDEIRPVYQQDLDGKMNANWTDYDAFCGPLIDGSAFADKHGSWAWPLPVDLHQPDPAPYGGLHSTVYSAVLKQYLDTAAAHFKKKGWLDRSYLYFNFPDGPNPTAEEMEQVWQLATLAHLVDPQLRFASRLIPQSMVPFGWPDHHFVNLTSVIDIWSTPARFQHAPTLKRLQTIGKQTWLWPDRPPFSGSIAVEAPPINARSMPWQAFLQGHDAIYLDQVTQWPEHIFDRPIQRRNQRSDTWLVYPGKMFGLDDPVPSVRLKQLQIGIQDYQRLRILEKNGRGETARLLASSLIKAAGTEAYGDNFQDGLYDRRVMDPALWGLARNILEDELQDTLHPHDAKKKGAALEAHSRWARFLSATRHIQAWPESAKLMIDDRSNRQGYLIKYEVAIRNDLRTSLSGSLAFEPLPHSASSVSDIVHVGPLEEKEMARKRLIAAWPTLPTTDLNGHFLQRILFDANESGRLEVSAPASIVQAPSTSFPITVDGRLDDWPANDLNAAGDFRLMTQQVEPGEKRGRAASQTIVYFSHDQGLLYIGIYAAVPPADAGVVSPDPPILRNFVEYEDLMPVGEDLVEILIDPTNAATQSGDLYHIILKSTGISIFERGVSTDPPLGRVRPWPGRPPKCSVTTTDFGWSAELAIPISTFGEQPLDNRVWGINLARLEPIRGEYSDWARAPRYCYDPHTLGNLLWP